MRNRIRDRNSERLGPHPPFDRRWVLDASDAAVCTGRASSQLASVRWTDAVNTKMELPTPDFGALGVA